MQTRKLAYICDIEGALLKQRGGPTSAHHGPFVVLTPTSGLVQQGVLTQLGQALCGQLVWKAMRGAMQPGAERAHHREILGHRGVP